LGNDAIYGAFADTKVTLPKFLGNDIRGGFRIQEAVADDLTNEFLRAAVVGFGTSFGAEQTLTALLEEESPEVEIALATVTKFCGNPINAFGAAFTVDEHSQLVGDLIVFGNRQGATITLDAFFEKFERNHAGASLRKRDKQSNKIWHNKKQNARRELQQSQKISDEFKAAGEAPSEKYGL